MQIRLPRAMPAISTLPTMTGSAALSEDIAVLTFLVASESGIEFSIARRMRSRFAHLEPESDFIEWGVAAELLFRP